MNIPFVDLKAQYKSIKPEIDRAISEVIGKTAFVGGPFLKSFEEAFARFCGVKNCVGVGNGTDAIYVALRALGIGSGDEVINFTAIVPRSLACSIKRSNAVMSEIIL